MIQGPVKYIFHAVFRMTSKTASTTNAEKPKLDVVIVNWNSANQLGECLRSIEASQHRCLTLSSVIVIDNASTDDSMNGLPASLPLVTIVNRSNRGFGAACNQGAAASNADFILFLNPDTRLCADSLDKVMSFLSTEAGDTVGICGIKLVDRFGQVARCCARFPSATRFMMHGLGMGRLIPKAGLFMTDWNHADTRYVDHVIGAFLIIRRSLFESLAGFDERFFVYYEDLDLSYRAKALGWPTLYFSGATAFHAGGGTSDQIKATRLFYAWRSRIQYAFKHFSILGAACVLLSILSAELLARCTFALIRRSMSTFIETLSAYLMLLRWLPQWLSCGNIR